MTEPTTFYSPGQLPPRPLVQEAVDGAYARGLQVVEGDNSNVYPELARADGDLFGICVVDTKGATHAAGDVTTRFTLMSVSKPFVFALACQHLGPSEARARLGVNSTGLGFNSLDAVPRSADGRTNPMVNPGAMATTDLLPGDDAEARWTVIVDGLSKFAGRRLEVDQRVLDSASATNSRNQEIARQLAAAGQIASDPADATALYTRQCCLAVTAEDLAVMGATLADGGVNPRTGEHVVDPVVCRHVLAVMTTAGLYEHSGDWLYDVGLPGKSGISGGIVTVAPGKGGLGTFSPRLDSAGNSVRGQHASAELARTLGLDLFASQPA